MVAIFLQALTATQSSDSTTLDCFDKCHTEPFCDLLPKGVMWPRDPDTEIHALCSALGIEFSRVDKRIDAMLENSYPDTAQESLEDWERVCGLPDLCDGELAPTVAERQADVVACVTQDHTLNDEFWETLANGLGYPAPVITKNSAFCTGVNCAGDLVCSFDALLTVTFTFPTGADDALLECKIRKFWSPIFTLVVIFV